MAIDSGERVLVLRTCGSERRGYGGFQWPESGFVEAPDWSPEPCCGRGLHGLLWGEGHAFFLSAAADAKWLVVAVDAANIVDLGGKVKFPRGEVVYCGQRDGAVAHILANGGKGKACAFARLTGGDESTLTGGDDSTLTGGDGSTLTGGDRSTLTGGDDSTLTGGDRSTLTGGDRSTLVFYRWDNAARRRRVVVAYVGEDGIEAGVAYRLSHSGNVVRAKLNE